MATPTAVATFNKTNYAVGETMVLTITHTDADRQTITVSGTVTDSSGNVGNWSATATIDKGVVEVTNSGGKTWVGPQTGSTAAVSILHAVA